MVSCKPIGSQTSQTLNLICSDYSESYVCNIKMEQSIWNICRYHMLASWRKLEICWHHDRLFIHMTWVLLMVGRQYAKWFALWLWREHSQVHGQWTLCDQGGTSVPVCRCKRNWTSSRFPRLSSCLHCFANNGSCTILIKCLFLQSVALKDSMILRWQADFPVKPIFQTFLSRCKLNDWWRPVLSR